MPQMLSEILKDSRVDEAELDALFKKYDKSGDGVLDFSEQLVLARDVAVLTGASVDTVLSVLDFYQRDWDDKIDAAELRAFLQVYVSE